MDKQDYASYVRSSRKKMGYTQQRLASELGMTQLAVTRWETGKTKPSSLAIQKLLELTANISKSENKDKEISINYMGTEFSTPIRVVPDGSMYSAYCDQLSVGDCGTTPEEAISELKLGVSVLCRALDKRGLLESRLKEKGIKYEHKGRK